MQPDEIVRMLKEHEEKLDKIYVSVEKTRKYIFWTVVISVIVFVLPLIGLMFVIPNFISNYSTNLQGAGL